MQFDIETYFFPSTGIELVFNLNSISPYTRTSIIYDTDYKNRRITIAQPQRPLTRNMEFDELHITTVFRGSKGASRAGLKCRPDRFIKNYQLAGQSRVEAVELIYTPPAFETNIRAAFRLQLRKPYTIKGKLLRRSVEFFTKRDFLFYDISLKGAGILIPKKVDKNANPLKDLERLENIKVGLVLLKEDEKESQPPEKKATIPASAQVMRVNENFSDKMIFAGLKFTKLTQENEEALYSFIHEAQIDELRKMSGL